MTRKRFALAVDTKKELIQFHFKNPNLSHEYLATYFSYLVGQKVDRSTVSRILSDKDKILECETPKTKKR